MWNLFGPIRNLEICKLHILSLPADSMWWKWTIFLQYSCFWWQFVQIEQQCFWPGQLIRDGLITSVNGKNYTALNKEEGLYSLMVVLNQILLGSSMILGTGAVYRLTRTDLGGTQHNIFILDDLNPSARWNWYLYFYPILIEMDISPNHQHVIPLVGSAFFDQGRLKVILMMIVSDCSRSNIAGQITQ